jgi:translation initiation factor IF-3
MRRRRFRPKKPAKVIKPAYRVNEHITAPVVAVIDHEDNFLGEMPVAEAIAQAQEQELDLVEVSPKAAPPVCRITNFGKIQYQKAKEARLRNATKKKVVTKGIRIGIKTGTNDLAFKQKQADKFLVKGNKVKIEIFLRGRENAYAADAKDNLLDFTKGLTTPFKVEEEIKKAPRGFQMTIAPE